MSLIREVHVLPATTTIINEILAIYNLIRDQIPAWSQAPCVIHLPRAKIQRAPLTIVCSAVLLIGRGDETEAPLPHAALYTSDEGKHWVPVTCGFRTRWTSDSFPLPTQSIATPSTHITGDCNPFNPHDRVLQPRQPTY